MSQTIEPIPVAEIKPEDLQRIQQMRDKRYVEFSQVQKAYPNPYGDPFVVVEDFNLIIPRGDLVSVIGHSGCGKSTILSMIAGLNSISQGGIVVDGREVAAPGPDRSVVFQAPCLLPWLTAFENVYLGVDRVYAEGTVAEKKQIVEYYMNVVGLYDARFKYPREMSGGMQQRVGIARAISLKPKVLLLDEPFGRLDSLTRMDLQDVILNILNRERFTTILITHDVDEAIYMSNKICMMTNGPRARVGKVMDLPFEQPRVRAEILDHPHYYDFRGELITFLSEQEHAKHK
jgi:nitrate/nitrite transport system ATP-binding protein